MKIETKGKNQTKKDLWVDGYYVGKIDEDHNEVKLEGLFDWFDDEKLNYAINEYYDELKFVGEVLVPTVSYTIEHLKYYESREYFKMEGCFLDFTASDENHIEVTEKELDSLELHTIGYFENKCLEEDLSEITLWAVYNENDEEVGYYED